MIYIEKSKVNTIYLTLSEMMSNEDNWILLTLTNEMQPSIIRYAILKDNISLIPNRVDAYEVTEVSDPTDVDIATANINLPTSGFWHYKAEEVEVQTTFDFDSLVIVKLLEIGRCNVYGVETITVDNVYL